MKANFYSNCIIIKGYNRDIVYDLFRCRYLALHRPISSILKNYDSKKHTQEFSSIVEKLIEDDFLYNKEIYDSKLLKCKFLTEYSSPEKIRSAIVKESNFIKNNLPLIFEKLESLECRVVVFLLKKNNQSFLTEVIKTSIPFDIEFIEFDISDTLILNEKLIRAINSNKKISSIKAKKITTFKKKASLLKCNLSITNTKSKLAIFDVNTALFCESILYNTYYNKKIFINEKADILPFF